MITEELREAVKEVIMDGLSVNVAVERSDYSTDSKVVRVTICLFGREVSEDYGYL